MKSAYCCLLGGLLLLLSPASAGAQEPDVFDEIHAFVTARYAKYGAEVSTSACTFRYDEPGAACRVMFNTRIRGCRVDVVAYPLRVVSPQRVCRPKKWTILEVDG